MPPLCAEHFDREIDCRETEWLYCLPRAIGSHPYHLVTNAASIQIGPGQLSLTWRSCAAAKVGTRLLVSFRYSGLDEAQRYLFMRKFESHLPQR